MATKNISLLAAVLICINTILGAGIFVNPKQLAILAGPYSIFCYLISGLIILPLIITIGELARLQPVSGGLYVYSKEYLSPIFGFLCSWSYFVAKSTSIAFLSHTVTSYFQTKIPFLQQFSILTLDYSVICSLCFINIAGVTIGSRIQYVFIAMKTIPLVFIFIAGFFCFNVSNFINEGFIASEFLSTIPVSLYALTGFEAICAIGGFIDNAATNIRKALLISFSIVTIIAITYQIVCYGSLGNFLTITNEPSYSIGSILIPTAPWLGAIISGIAFASITAGAFSMTATNCWNLYTIGKNNHLPGSSYLTKTTVYNTPWVALLIQASVSLLMITITTQQLALQNMVTFCGFSAFLLTAIAAIQAIRQGKSSLNIAIPTLGIISCIGVITLCLHRIILYGISVPFLVILMSGCLLVALKKAHLFSN